MLPRIHVPLTLATPISQANDKRSGLRGAQDSIKPLPLTRISPSGKTRHGTTAAGRVSMHRRSVSAVESGLTGQTSGTVVRHVVRTTSTRSPAHTPHPRPDECGRSRVRAGATDPIRPSPGGRRLARRQHPYHGAGPTRRSDAAPASRCWREPASRPVVCKQSANGGADRTLRSR